MVYKMFSKWFKLSAIWLCKESRGKKAGYTSLELSIIASYLYHMPDKIGSDNLSSNFYNLHIMYIKSNESLTIP